MHMFALLNKIYSDAENLKGKNLVRVLFIVFTAFLVVGILVGYLNTLLLNRNENIIQQNQNSIVTPNSDISMEGNVVYVDPSMYPEDNVSYILVNSKGDELILLRSNDQKLKIVEGLQVKVVGQRVKSRNGKSDILVVKEVQLNNDTN